MRRIEPPSEERMKLLLEAGFNAAAISRLYNVTPSTAGRWVSAYKKKKNG